MLPQAKKSMAEVNPTPQKKVPQLSVIEGVAKNSTGFSSLTGTLDELYFNKPIRTHVREFGAVMALVCSIIAIFKSYHFSPLWVPTSWMIGGLAFYASCISFPAQFRPLWQAWMKFAHYLGLVMSVVILAVLWILLFIPISTVLKTLGKRVMDLRFHADVQSYWEDRAPEKHSFKLLERQF